MRMPCIYLSLIFISLFSFSAQAQTWIFDPSMLNDKSADLTLFNQGIQPPGVYTVDILVNEEQVATRDVKFSVKKNADGTAALYPCLLIKELSEYGIKTENYPALIRNGECIDLSAIPDASINFDFNNKKLAINVPQISMRLKQKGIAPQALWDDGIPALMLDYTANITRTEYHSYADGESLSDDRYIQLNPGINYGAWRLRNQTHWSKQGDNQPARWQTVYTYAERGINRIKSRLTLGDSSTTSDIFDSVPFRGAMLASDDNMIPYSERAFAPVVRGIARTQARVEVKQNGYVIYSSSVSAGPFSLSDLTTSGADGGDLQVTVYESDGTTQRFTVPYQTPAIAVKEGYLKYGIMAGLYRPSESDIEKSPMAQFTAMYGLPLNTTLYSGLQTSKHYAAISAGAGLSMGDLGAISLDTIWSQGQGQRQNQATETGNAWRLRYSKNVMATNTTFTLASYQFNSGQYETLSDVLDSWQKNSISTDNSYQKSRSSVSISQSLDNFGYLSLSGTHTDYRNGGGHDNSFGASYGLTLPHDIALSVNWTDNQSHSTGSDKFSKRDRIVSFWVSVPLDQLFKSDKQVNATYQLIAETDKNNQQEFGLNGDSFDQQLHWDVRQRSNANSANNNLDNGLVNLTWYGTYGQIGGSYSYSPEMRQLGANISGGALVHRNGLTLSQPLGDTIALVKAPGADGVRVIGNRGVKTDMRGYTTDYSLTPYQKNTISLDPLSMSDDVDIMQTDVNVVPTRGAVVLAQFKTKVGAKALMQIKRRDDNLIPFGSLVTIEGQDGTAGIVGENSEVYLTGLPASGRLLVK